MRSAGDAGFEARTPELADAVGITGPTLTHHLNAMESDALITRRPSMNDCAAV